MSRELRHRAAVDALKAVFHEALDTPHSVIINVSNRWVNFSDLESAVSDACEELQVWLSIGPDGGFYIEKRYGSFGQIN
jgi:hypothetical protein